MNKTGKERQQRYRALKAKQGVVPYQLQVFEKDKVLFEQLAIADAQGVLYSYDKNTNGSAEARRQLFHKLVNGEGVTFKMLREQVNPSLASSANNSGFLKQELENYRLKLQDLLNIIEQLSQENDKLKKQAGITSESIDYDMI